MQKRLTARDWILYSLLLLMIVLMVLLMYQVDRQWSKLAQMEVSLQQQSQDLRQFRTSLSAGQIKPSEASTTITNSVNPAFARAYSASQQPDYAMGDWVVSGMVTNISTLTPLISRDAYASEIQSYIFETLLTRDADTLEWQGLLAKSWQVSEDGLKITLQLRDDVTFSDGKPMTAEDVVFSFNLVMNEAIDAPASRSSFEKVESVVATNPYEVVFTYKEPYFRALLLAGSLTVLPKHFYEPYLKDTNTFNQSKALVLGTGPYRLENPSAWKPDQSTVELVRNDRYWGDVQPPYERLLWKIIQNDSARLTTFRNGDIDSYSARPIELDTLMADKQITDSSQNFSYMPSVGVYYYLGWNQQRNGEPTFFADKRVRLALTYLTDVDRIIKDIYLGKADPAIAPFNKSSQQHNPELTAYPFDLEKARSLLAEAGFADRNGDGVLEDNKGKAFEFELMYPEANEDHKRMVLLLKDIYARAGVKLIPSPQEFPVMLEKLDKRNYDAVSIGWTGLIESDLYQIFHSSQITQGDNFISYKNTELDKLIDQARVTVDDEKRMQLWRDAEKIIYEDQPYTFLVRPQTILFINKRFKNLYMTNLGLNWGGTPIDTYVPVAQQKYKP